MNIREIALTGFMSHDATVVKLPASGVVLVVGENGSGKSAIVEGVAFSGWGKTLRGDVPWRDDAKTTPCAAQITTDAMRIRRTRKGAKGEVEWECFDGVDQDAPGASSGDAGEYDTPTKAQEALTQMLGPFDLWRRCSVFSTADAAHFALATDSDRKRLIESFLGLNRFDPALEACRIDLKASTVRLSDLLRAQEVGSAKFEAARTRLQEARKALAAAKPPDEPPKTLHGAPGSSKQAPQGKPLAELDAAVAVARAELTGMREQLRAADRAGAGFDQLASQAHTLLEKLRGEACPTCTQSIPPRLRKDIRLSADQAKAKAEEARKKANKGRNQIEAHIEELDEEIGALQTHRDARAREETKAKYERQLAEERANALEAERTRYAKQRVILEKALREADDSIATLTLELEAVDRDLQHTNTVLGELKACEIALGLKGVRAHILSKALTGIQAMANMWLHRLHDHVTITLSAYSDKGVADSISLVIQGVGRGSYKSTSGGERRRVDLALLLALGEVSNAARGQATSTMFFDECLDALDDNGVEAVAAALQDLAKDRCCVVITHNDTLVSRMPGAMRYRVDAGVVTLETAA